MSQCVFRHPNPIQDLVSLTAFNVTACLPSYRNQFQFCLSFASETLQPEGLFSNISIWNMLSTCSLRIAIGIRIYINPKTGILGVKKGTTNKKLPPPPRLQMRFPNLHLSSVHIPEVHLPSVYYSNVHLSDFRNIQLPTVRFLDLHTPVVQLSTTGEMTGIQTNDLPFMAPLLLSVLIHVILILWVAITSILSAWTKHRVGLAEAAYPIVEEPTPSFAPKYTLSYSQGRPTSPPSPKSVAPPTRMDQDMRTLIDSSAEPKPFYTPPKRQVEFSPVPFKRSLSLGSKAIDLAGCFEKPLNSPPCQRSNSYGGNVSSPTSTATSSPLYCSTGSRGCRMEEIPFLVLNDAPGLESEQYSTYGIFEDEGPNSPTDFFFHDRKGVVVNSRGSFSSEGGQDSERVNGLKALCLLAVVRCAVVAPLVWYEMQQGQISVSPSFGTWE